MSRLCPVCNCEVPGGCSICRPGGSPSRNGYAPDCADCPTPDECKAKNDCQVTREIRHARSWGMPRRSEASANRTENAVPARTSGNTPTKREPSADSSGKPGTEARHLLSQWWSGAIDNAEFKRRMDDALMPTRDAEEGSFGDRLSIALARHFKVSKGTVLRWLNGESAPHPLAQEPIFRALESMQSETGHRISLDRALNPDHYPPLPKSTPERWIDEVIREIQEMPDRTSPDDFPEAMLVTGPELRRILEACAPRSAEETTFAAQEINDAIDVAECCIHDQIHDPNEHEHVQNGLKKVRELALAADNARRAMVEQVQEIIDLRIKLRSAPSATGERELETLWHFATCPFDHCERCIADEQLIMGIRDRMDATDSRTDKP